MSGPSRAAEAWRSSLEALAIPAEILAQAPADPWQLPRELFVVEDGADLPTTPSRRHAAEALRPGGSVLDVGCGGGRASLALVPPAAEVTGVDESAEMLTEFSRAAGARGVAAAAVPGKWPDVAAEGRIKAGRCRRLPQRRLQRGRSRALRHGAHRLRQGARRPGAHRSSSAGRLDEAVEGDLGHRPVRRPRRRSCSRGGARGGPRG